MTNGPATEFELLTVGRICVDLYANEAECQLHRPADLHEVDRWLRQRMSPYQARLGRRSAVFTKVGDDPFGQYVRWALAETFGVDTRYVGTDPVSCARPWPSPSSTRPTTLASSSTGSPRPRTSTSSSATSTWRSRRACPCCGCRPARCPPSPAAEPSTSC